MLDFNGFRFGAFDMLLVCLFFKTAMKIDLDLQREYELLKKQDSKKIQKMKA
jgi:hypothetical protein